MCKQGQDNPSRGRTYRSIRPFSVTSGLAWACPSPSLCNASVCVCDGSRHRGSIGCCQTALHPWSPASFLPLAHTNVQCHPIKALVVSQPAAQLDQGATKLPHLLSPTLIHAMSTEPDYFRQGLEAVEESLVPSVLGTMQLGRALYVLHLPSQCNRHSLG